MMKAKLRNQVAGLALLVPVALAFVAQPAAAQQQVAAPRITGMSLNADHGLDPGSVLRIEVRGTPGATASVHFGKTEIRLALRETESGVYHARYTVLRDDRIDPTSAINVRLTRGGATARHAFTYPPSFQALAMGVAAAPAPGLQAVVPRIERERDSRAPAISNLSPRQGDIVSPVGTTLIAGEFDDGPGRGVDPRSVRLTLDGRDVTNQAHITPERFDYRTDLPPGPHAVEVSARDFAGNIVSRSWSFDVGQSRASAAPGALPLHLTGPAHGSQVDASADLVVRGSTVPWATVRIRVDAVPPVFGHMLGVAQLVYSVTVEADRDGRFSVRVNPRIPVVPGMRYDVSVTATRGDQAAESRITLHQRG